MIIKEKENPLNAGWGDFQEQQTNINKEQHMWLEDLAMTYSPVSWDKVPSALRGLTTEFGMGSGGTLSLKSPNHLTTYIEQRPQVWGSSKILKTVMSINNLQKIIYTLRNQANQTISIG